jgi:uncharacterized membrane protein YoaK (UPF0700 family)
MQRHEPPLIAVAICLAALAGFLDALAFTSLGGFFAASMSGNATRLGVGLGTGAAGDATLAGAMVLSFVSGVILATVIVRARAADFGPAVIGAVAALLGGAALIAELRSGPLALLLLAGAMGAAHVLLRRTGEAGASAHLTDSLVRMGEGIADAMMGVGDRLGWLPHFLTWTGFVAGAVMGAGAFFAIGLDALWFAAAAASAVAIWFLARRRMRPTPS